MIITLVSPPDCPNCAELQAEIDELKNRYSELEVAHIDALSPEGEKLVLQHGILASPGVLVDSQFFGMGAISIEKLESHITTGS